MIDTDIMCYIAMGLALTLLVIRRRRKGAETSGSFLSKPLHMSFAKKRDLAVLVFKKCPQCAEQLPVSTLVCHSCDYNFLASSILRHKMLPAPESANTGVAPQQAFAYRT